MCCSWLWEGAGGEGRASLPTGEGGSAGNRGACSVGRGGSGGRVENWLLSRSAGGVV